MDGAGFSELRGSRLCGCRFIVATSTPLPSSIQIAQICANLVVILLEAGGVPDLWTPPPTATPDMNCVSDLATQAFMID